jgi:fructose-1-phosphate kinase PfkB-like protein
MSKRVLVINTNPLLNLVHQGTIDIGVINRVQGFDMHAEGKGVNVARVLSRLGQAVTVTGFAGGHSGEWLRELVIAEGITEAFVPSKAPMRVGFMAAPSQFDHPTTLLPSGFPVTEGECEGLYQRVDELLTPEVGLMIISGSVPCSTVAPLYPKLLTLANQKAIPCWLDAHGEGLVQALEGNVPPLLAKPNREEFRETTHWKRVPELHITDGEKPIEIILAGFPALRITPPEIQQINPVGCGDCYLAGLAYGVMQGWSLEDRIRFASAAGTANAARQDVAQISPDEISKYLDGVRIERI